MATKKTTAKPPAKRNPDAFEVEPSNDTPSQTLAKLIASSTLAATTLKQYAGTGAAMEVSDLVTEMRKAGDEAMAGDLGRVERMLVNQMLTLDGIFHNMAQRAHREGTFKGVEVLMRLGLKAQAQARSTAEALAEIKNPTPYIRQANISHGHQQVNNGQQATGAGNSKSGPKNLLEADSGGQMIPLAGGTIAGSFKNGHQ